MRINARIIVCLVLGSIFMSCSTQQNTAMSRSFHATKTKYNIYYNGYTSYDEGLRKIRESAQNDYTQVLPLYSVSDHKAAESSASQMDATIEKCRKCIKLHSIKKKPKINSKKRNDPQYKAWYNQEEFNKNMDDAWMLLGKAEFHKGDFIGSIGTFNYISKHYDYDKDVIAQCQLWSARAYGEIEWLYEAEDLLNKVNQDDLAKKHSALYASAQADIKIKNKQYKEAIPFVKLVLADEPKKNGEKARMTYVLAQLYEYIGEKQKAADTYKKVISLNPSLDLDFNARIQQTQLTGDWQSAIKELNKMAKRIKYKDNLDRIYGALGNVYLAHKDTTKALEHYQKAAENSTENGMAKGIALLTAADIYYEKQDYVNAAPCYKDAVNIIPTEHEAYKRVKKRAETLDLVVKEATVVTLEDSLQNLAKLSPEEQMKVAEKIVEELKKQEEEAAAKAAEDARQAELGNGLNSINTSNMIGGGGAAAEWYFYNTSLMRSGKQLFTQKWGNRPLEDDWRRLSKAVVSTLSDEDEEDEDFNENDSIANDSTKKAPKQKVATDIHDPQFYLQQIPKTEEDIAQSNAKIADALFNLVYIYQEQVEDQNLADETFEEFEKRFPNDTARLVDLYYSKYLNCLKKGNKEEAEKYRQTIISRFPETSQAKIVADADYFNKLQRMAIEQDSVFEDTYNKYRAGNFDSVKVNKQYAEENYPLSPLMPKFLFLNAIAVAKTENQEAFFKELEDLVTRYPESDVGAMGKDMLAMMNQGMESQQNGDMSGLLDKRGQIEDTDSLSNDTLFTTEKQQNSFVYLIAKGTEEQMNNLLYQVALFNFTQFLIKDFDLRLMAKFTAPDALEYSALEISGFDSYDATLWYTNLLKENEELNVLFKWLDVQIVCITESNLQVLNRTSLADYNTFLESTEKKY